MKYVMSIVLVASVPLWSMSVSDLLTMDASRKKLTSIRCSGFEYSFVDGFAIEGVRPTVFTSVLLGLAHEDLFKPGKHGIKFEAVWNTTDPELSNLATILSSEGTYTSMDKIGNFSIPLCTSSHKFESRERGSNTFAYFIASAFGTTGTLVMSDTVGRLKVAVQANGGSENLLKYAISFDR